MLTSREELLAGCRRASASLPAEQTASLPDSPQGSPYPRRDVAAGNPHPTLTLTLTLGGRRRGAEAPSRAVGRGNLHPPRRLAARL